jgi:hypothetical protein
MAMYNGRKVPVDKAVISLFDGVNIPEIANKN